MLSNTFTRTYPVHDVQSWENASFEQKQALEDTRNILLPESALNELIAYNCDFPIILQVSNYEDSTQITTVGVQEFSSLDGIATLPHTLLQRLSYPKTIRVTYVQLPSAQTIQFQPHNSSFLKHENKIAHIRTKMGTLQCLSIDDTIQVSIGDNNYKLNVTKVTPSIYNAVSLSNAQWSVQITFTDAITNDDEIIDDANIHSTKEGCDESISVSENENEYVIDTGNDTLGNTIGNTIGDTLGGGEEENNNTDYEFDSNSDDHAWGDTESYSSFDYDGQDHIPIKDKTDEFTPPPYDKEPLIPDRNRTDDGNSRQLKPVKTKIDRRAWICEFCHAINNLLDSTKRNYKCISCVGKYRPGQTLIESKEQDQPMEQKQKYSVWQCICSCINADTWAKCDLCDNPKPNEGFVITFLTDEKPQPRIKPAPPQQPRSSSPKEVANVVFRDGGFAMEEEPNVQLQEYKPRPVYGSLWFGSAKHCHSYPIISHTVSINPRLVDKFGKGYRNAYHKSEQQTYANKWCIDNEIIHGRMDIISNPKLDFLMYINVREITAKFDGHTYLTNIPILGNRCMAINERNGYIACLISKFLIVCAPVGCNQFVIEGFLPLSEDQIISKKYAKECRVRYVNDAIYVFHSNSYYICKYKFTPNDSLQSITFDGKIYDSYFVESSVVDFMVTEQLLIVLFDRWLGVYKLKPELTWFHAVAYSKNDSISPHSLEMSTFDDWEQEIDAVRDEEEEKRDSETKIYPTEMEYKKSIKNYIFVNCEHQIIGLHPTNPTFDFLHIASNVKNGSSFCNSRQYGTFWVNNECDRVMQSAKFDHCVTECVFSLEEQFKWDKFQAMPVCNGQTLDTKNITKLNGVMYDEGYGISGRLLINCDVKYSNKETALFYQLLNLNELLILKQEFHRKDYFLMPGTNLKPFNLIVYVFEMLYGTDLIDSLIQSPNFNSVYALPGMNDKEIQIENKENELKESEDILNNDNMNKLLKMGSHCLVLVNDRWQNGIVTKLFEIDEIANELLEIAYGSYGVVYSKVTLSRYDKNLKYNEDISFKEYKKMQWNISDECLYFCKANNGYCPAKITCITYENGQTYLHISYFLDAEAIEKIDLKDAILCMEEMDQGTLRKLDDVVKHSEKDLGKEKSDDSDMELEGPLEKNVAMMDIMGEGPLAQSYIAIKAVEAIGNVKAENDEDLVFVEDDMEIEQEGMKQ